MVFLDSFHGKVEQKHQNNNNKTTITSFMRITKTSSQGLNPEESNIGCPSGVLTTDPVLLGLTKREGSSASASSTSDQTSHQLLFAPFLPSMLKLV